MPRSAGAFVQADRLPALRRAAQGCDRHVELAGFVSPLDVRFFFARIGIRALRASLQEARRLG